MMKKACLVLIALSVPASLFAGETMVTQTTYSTKCNFRVDKCQTEVAVDPSYDHYKDGSVTGPFATTPLVGDPTRSSTFGFANYKAEQHSTLDELVALIREKLRDCPEVSVSYDNDTGFLTVHYLKATCDCDCDWTINVRDVKATDFVWTRTNDNYSPRLGQMERRKFHTANQSDAEDIQSACNRICTLNLWTMSN